MCPPATWLDTFKMGLHCLQLLTTDYIAGAQSNYKEKTPQNGNQLSAIPG
jgi:hypothetical protein